MIRLEPDNAVYGEDYDSFLNPTYKGFCRSVNIIPVDKYKRWMCCIDKSQSRVESVRIFNSDNVSPYQCLVSGSSIFGSGFINDIISRLQDDTTEFYCMVYRGYSRNYYIMVDVSSRRLVMPRNTEGHCYNWYYPYNISRVSEETDIIIFKNKLQILLDEDMYGARNIKIYGKDILEYNSGVSRIGIIPYDIVDGKIKLVMSINKGFKIGDFGGGVKIMNKESCLSALKRECIEEAGIDNWNLISHSLSRSKEIYVWHANVKDDDRISMIILTRIDINKFNKIDPNYEIESYSLVEYDDIIKYNINQYHHPIRPFINYISKQNNLIGYPCSCINNQGCITIESNTVIYTDSCFDSLCYESQKFSPLPLPCTLEELPGRILEDTGFHPMLMK